MYRFVVPVTQRGPRASRPGQAARAEAADARRDAAVGEPPVPAEVARDAEQDTSEGRRRTLRSNSHDDRTDPNPQRPEIEFDFELDFDRK